LAPSAALEPLCKASPCAPRNLPKPLHGSLTGAERNLHALSNALKRRSWRTPDLGCGPAKRASAAARRADGYPA
jgi:hypothetical protein